MIKRKNNPTSVAGGEDGCTHPAYYNSLCVSCGQKLSAESLLFKNSSSPSSTEKNVNFTLSGGSQLKLSSDEAERVEQSKRQSLHSMRKLALILDIDHTLLHATASAILPSQADMKKYELECIAVHSDDNMSSYYHLIKLRPGLFTFLEEVNKNYQLSIYTNGTRAYAESVVKLIDPTGALFRRRIMSRSDAPVPDSVLGGPPVNQCAKSLARLFVGDSAHMAVILDDREDVWKGPQGLQLLIVRPFLYFMDAREVNNASGVLPSALSAAADAISLSGERPGSLRRVQHDGPSSAIYGHVGGYGICAQAHFDDQLERSLIILNRLHDSYYSIYDQQSSTKSETKLSNSIDPKIDMRVESILTYTKSKVLTGCSIVFSGLIPKSDPFPEYHYFWRLAKSLGARVTLDLDSQTTHLVANINQVQLPSRAEKVTLCVQRDNVFVVHSDWLLYCRYSLAKAEEKTFSMLPGVPSSLHSSQVDSSSPPTAIAVPATATATDDDGNNNSNAINGCGGNQNGVVSNDHSHGDGDEKAAKRPKANSGSSSSSHTASGSEIEIVAAEKFLNGTAATQEKVVTECDDNNDDDDNDDIFGDDFDLALAQNK